MSAPDQRINTAPQQRCFAPLLWTGYARRQAEPTNEDIMRNKVEWRILAGAVVSATILGVVVGLGAGYAARAFGWPTGFAGPLAGGLVSALVTVIYQLRAKRDGAA